MWNFSKNELANMRAAQTAHMMDECTIQRYSQVYTSGERIATYTDDPSSIMCGLDMQPGRENHRQDMTAVTWDATLRLPLDTLIDPKDRIKIVKRFGEDITPLVYRIESPIWHGASGLRLRLKRVEI